MPNRMLVALCMALSVVLASCSMTNGHDTSAHSEGQEEALTAKALDDYSWDELSDISRQIEAAEAAEAGRGREVAKEFGLVGEDGKLSSQTKMIVLDDTRALDVRIAGILHDDKADGSGKAGLTFMSVGALEVRPMNDAGIEGGWASSDLRGWLAADGKSMLEEDLAQALVPVRKLSNNVGYTDDVASVSDTEDELWAFSAHEVCGDVRWDTDEFRQQRGYEDVDAIVNAEGTQYEVFAAGGVTYASDPSGMLSLEKSTGAMPWWYRTPYPFEWTYIENTGASGYFYQVSESGYPESLGATNEAAGVVIGFCV